MIFYYYPPENISKELGEAETLRLTNNGSGTIDIEKIRSAEKDAEIIIDYHLSGRYSLPFDNDNVPAIVRLIAKQLTFVNLYEASDSKTGIPEAIIWKKTDAMKLLKLVQTEKYNSSQMNFNHRLSALEKTFINFKILFTN